VHDAFPPLPPTNFFFQLLENRSRRVHPLCHFAEPLCGDVADTDLLTPPDMPKEVVPMICVGTRPRYCKVNGKSMRSSHETPRVLDRHSGKNAGSQSRVGYGNLSPISTDGCEDDGVPVFHRVAEDGVEDRAEDLGRQTDNNCSVSEETEG